MPASHLRILYLTSHWPYGQSTGLRVRLQNIGRTLARLGDVSLVCCTDEQVAPQAIADAAQHFASVELAPVQLCPDRKPLDRIRHEFDPSYLNTYGQSVVDDARRSLRSRLEQYDVIWIHTVRTANAFGIERWPKSVLDVDDLPSQLYASMVESSALGLRRLLDRRMERIWRRRERRFAKRFDTLAVCSKRDGDLLGSPETTVIVPNGFVDPTSDSPFQPRGQLRLGFIGLLTYPPNREGLKWFLQEVWPSVQRQIPNARFRVVGQGADESLLASSPGVDLLGYVDDPASEISSWSATIVPLRFGAGTRVKIAEAFSRRCPVVSTSLGAYGYEVQDQRELLLADSPEDFALASVRLLLDADLGRELTERAWQRFNAEWSRDAVSLAVEAAVSGAMRRTSERTSRGYRRDADSVVGSRDRTFERLPKLTGDTE